MCVRYTLTAEHKEILRSHPLTLVGDKWEPHYNIAPTLKGLVITADEPKLIQYMRFGIVPYWAESLVLKFDTWNIRSEEVMEKKMYRPLMVHQKTCLIIADGFYEWFNAKPEKLPYRFTVKNRKTFCFAGLWSEWVDPETKEAFRTCGIMTTVANKMVAEVHYEKPRMPVILDKNGENMWLNKYLSPTEKLKLCVPFPDELMTKTRVSTRVNKVHKKDKPNNDEGLILPLNTDEEPKMIDMGYTCEVAGVEVTYTIKKSQVATNFHIFHVNTLIGIINKGAKGWEQVSGRDMGDEIINNLGELINKHL